MTTISIVVLGKFQTAYHFARYLEANGELERLVTMLPYARGREFGVSKENTHTVSALGYWNHGFERYGPRSCRALSQLATSMAFGHAAARALGNPAALNAWSSVALESIRRAHALGIPAVLTTGSTHIGWQTDELKAELKRFDDNTPLAHPRLVARVITEYDESDLIVVPSRMSKETFVERGIPVEKVVVVPWAVRPLTTPCHRRSNTVPTILFVGNTSLRKGIPYLLAAFRQLSLPARLRLVGPTNERLLRRLGGVPDGVEVVGPRRGQALADEFRTADMFVMASIEEGSAIATIEAMFAGLPVVVTDRAGADQVIDGRNGFVVPARDPDALADRLGRLIADASLRDELGRTAAAGVQTRTWSDYGRDLLEDVFWPQWA